jgi:hypothetical protein
MDYIIVTGDPNIKELTIPNKLVYETKKKPV